MDAYTFDAVCKRLNTPPELLRISVYETKHLRQLIVRARHLCSDRSTLVEHYDEVYELIHRIACPFNHVANSYYTRRDLKLVMQAALERIADENLRTFAEINLRTGSSFAISVELTNKLTEIIVGLIKHFSTAEWCYNPERVIDTLINAITVCGPVPAVCNMLFKGLLSIFRAIQENQTLFIRNQGYVQPWSKIQLGILSDNMQRFLLVNYDALSTLEMVTPICFFLEVFRIIRYLNPGGIVVSDMQRIRINMLPGPRILSCQQLLTVREAFDNAVRVNNLDEVEIDNFLQPEHINEQIVVGLPVPDNARPQAQFSGSDFSTISSASIRSFGIYTGYSPCPSRPSPSVQTSDATALSEEISSSDLIRCDLLPVYACVSFLGNTLPSSFLRRAVIADTGASEHFFNALEYFPHGVDMARSGSVTGVGTMRIAGRGDAVLCGRDARTDESLTLILHGASYVPDLITSVVSISKITCEGWRATFQRSASYLCDANETTRIDLSEHGGLYLLKVRVVNERDQNVEQAYSHVAVRFGLTTNKPTLKKHLNKYVCTISLCTSEWVISLGALSLIPVEVCKDSHTVPLYLLISVHLVQSVNPSMSHIHVETTRAHVRSVLSSTAISTVLSVQRQHFMVLRVHLDL